MKLEKSNLKIPTTNNQTPKSIKGITLVALVVTIVVLIILAGVTLNIVIDQNGIIAKAREGANQYYDAQINEQQQILDMEEYVSISTGKVPRTVEKYFLGENGTGRFSHEIADESGFINEEDTIPDANTTLTIYYADENGVYIKYKNVGYRITVDLLDNIEKIKTIELIYVPQGNEGRTVGYDTNGDGTIGNDERWTVITDRDGIFEIVSNSAMGSLTLGNRDTTVTVTEDLDGDETTGDNGDKAIASYNNAIETINNYCKTLVTEENNEGVRSVGGSTDRAGAYSSENFNTWFKGKGSVKAVDIYLEQDFKKMMFLGIVDVDSNYWLASRGVVGDSDSMDFGVYCVDSDGSSYIQHWWSLYSDGSVHDVSPSLAVRPVVINPSGIQYID